MSNHSPIPSPSPSLIARWWDEAKQNAKYDEPIGPLVATQAARWGADMELEACVEWLANRYGEESHVMDLLRAARRPKPRLKEQALHELNDVYNRDKIDDSTYDTIRRALEGLDD